MTELMFAEQKSQLLAGLRGKIEGNRTAVDKALELLGESVNAPEGRALLAGVQEARDRYASASVRVLALMEGGRREEAAELVESTLLPALEALQQRMKILLESQKANVAAGAGQKIDAALTLMMVLDGAPSAVWRSSSPGEF